MLVQIKHPTMQNREGEVALALSEPDEVRRSRNVSDVYLFYRLQRPGRWICVVAKRLNGEGFIMTTYPADNIKEGERIWTR